MKYEVILFDVDDTLLDFSISEKRALHRAFLEFGLPTGVKDYEACDAVTSIVKRLEVRPSFIIAKGGITSSDIGTNGLSVKRATVAGQIKPGIPVWLTGSESKFPGIAYVIFPGNVGSRTTLKEVAELLHQ